MHTPGGSSIGRERDSACTMACSVSEPLLAGNLPLTQRSCSCCADAAYGHRDLLAALEATLWCPHTAALPSWTPRYAQLLISLQLRTQWQLAYMQRMSTSLSSCPLLQCLCLLASHNDPSWHIQSCLMECFTTHMRSVVCYETLVRFSEHHTKAEYIQGLHLLYLYISSRLHDCATVLLELMPLVCMGRPRWIHRIRQCCGPAGPRSDSDELAKENNKSVAALKGQAVFSVAKVRATQLTID